MGLKYEPASVPLHISVKWYGQPHLLDRQHHLLLCGGCVSDSLLGFRVQGSGFRVQGSGFRVQGSGYRVQGSGFGVGAGGWMSGLDGPGAVHTERCQPRQKSRVERLKAKVEPLLN